MPISSDEVEAVEPVQREQGMCSEGRSQKHTLQYREMRFIAPSDARDHATVSSPRRGGRTSSATATDLRRFLHLCAVPTCGCRLRRGSSTFRRRSPFCALLALRAMLHDSCLLLRHRALLHFGTLAISIPSPGYERGLMHSAMIASARCGGADNGSHPPAAGGLRKQARVACVTYVRLVGPVNGSLTQLRPAPHASSDVGGRCRD
jgi:hypothetical protein